MFDLVPFRKNNKVGSRNGDAFDDLWSNFFGDDFFAPVLVNNSSFKVDLKEDDASYTVDADLPGIKKEDISLDYENNYLTISAKRDETVEDKKDNYVRRERHTGEFKRSFYVDNVNEDNITASFTDGVLKINLPKKEIGIEKKKIDIN